MDTAAVNAFIIYNILAHRSGCRTISENDFRDTLVLQTIKLYGWTKRNEPGPGRPCRSDCSIRHGSRIFDESQKAQCQLCQIQSKTNWTPQKCMDCPFQPALCQTVSRDCHHKWHLASFDAIREHWIAKRQSGQASGQVSERLRARRVYSRKASCVARQVASQLISRVARCMAGLVASQVGSWVVS